MIKEPEKIIYNDRDIDIPSSVATCPECGGAVVVEVYEIQQDENTGDWHVAGSGVHVSCVDDRDSPHYRMPYVDWLPLEPRILKWINARYNFNPF